MSESLDREIRSLQNAFWSTRDPEGRAFAPLADAHRRKGDLDEATTLVEDGVRRLPDFSSGHLVAALVERDRGNPSGARAHLDRVLALDGQNVTALFERGCLALKASATEAALGDLREALRLEPGHREAREWLKAAEEGGGAPMDLAPTEAAAPREHLDAPFELGASLDLDARAETEPTFELDAPIELEVPIEIAASNEADMSIAAPVPAAPETSVEPDLPDVWGEPETQDFGLVSEIAPPEDLPLLPDLEAVVPMEPIDVAPAREVAPLVDLETTELAAPAPPEDRLKTRTLGELYAKQGLYDRAVEVFEYLAAQNPGQEGIASRLKEFRALAGAGAARGGAGASAEAAAADVVRTGRTIGAYFQELMAWVPARAGGSSVAAPPESQERRDAVPIGSLAPSGGAVPIGSLAPPAVPIGSLAPGAPVPIESLAPDRPGPSDDMDDFQSWLKSLKP